MVVAQVLLVHGCSGEGDVASFVQDIYVVFECFFCVRLVVGHHPWCVKLDVARQDHSAPYTMKNGLYWVDLFGVVRRLQSTDGSSSTQAPAARLSGTRRHFLMPLQTRPLAFSTCPLDCGCETGA